MAGHVNVPHGSVPPVNVPLVNLQGQVEALRAEIDAAVARTLDSGWYVLGNEVASFEEEFAAYLARLSAPLTGAPSAGEQVTGEERLHCVGVNSGTDALQLALWACDIGPGDEVITVAHTAVATAAAIQLAGATPVFVDIDPETYTLDPGNLAAAITPRTKAVLPVHLYGHPAEMETILQAARRAGLRVIEDCAQAHGAQVRQQAVGTLGDLGCFSFYPTKNLGALGDGGAVVGRDGDLVERVRLLREYGWTPQSRYVSQTAGMNSRLDELQAAILRAKLGHLAEWNGARRRVAAAYADRLPQELTRPTERPGCRHVYHLYVVRTTARDALRTALREAGIGTGIHYPVPVHQQPAYRTLPASALRHPLPHTERAAGEILSLPMDPLLTEAQIEAVVAAVQQAVRALR